MDKNMMRVVIALLGFVMAVQVVLADVEASVPPNSAPVTLISPSHPPTNSEPVAPIIPPTVAPVSPSHPPTNCKSVTPVRPSHPPTNSKLVTPINAPSHPPTNYKSIPLVSPSHPPTNCKSITPVSPSHPPTNSEPVAPIVSPPHNSLAQPPVDPKYCREICSHRCTKQRSGTYEICHSMCMMECEATGHISPDIPPTRRYKDVKKAEAYVN